MEPVTYFSEMKIPLGKGDRKSSEQLHDRRNTRCSFLTRCSAIKTETRLFSLNYSANCCFFCPDDCQSLRYRARLLRRRFSPLVTASAETSAREYENEISKDPPSLRAAIEKPPLFGFPRNLCLSSLRTHSSRSDYTFYATRDFDFKVSVENVHRTPPRSIQSNSEYQA